MSRVEFDDSLEFENIYSILENVYEEIFQFIPIHFKGGNQFIFFFVNKYFI